MLAHLRRLPRALVGSEVIHVIVLRVFLAIMALVAMRLTFALLPELHFVVFVNILFGFSLASAGLSALKRNFWMNFSPDAVGTAIVGGSILSIAVTSITASITVFIASELPVDMLITAIGAALLMAAARNVERFAYGFYIMDKKTLTAFGFGIAFAGSEIAIVLLMLVLGIESLAMRVSLPSLVFIAFISFGGGLSRILDYVGRRELPWSIGGFTRDAIAIIFSGTGVLSLLLAVCTISSGMLDRLLLGAMCQSGTPFNCSTASALLLVFTYGLAFQTMMNAVLDWLKPRVYTNGVWMEHARFNLGKAFALLAVLGLSLPLLGWPVGQVFALVPPEIDFWLWTTIFARFSLFALIMLFQVDLWMSQNFVRAIPVWVVIILGILATYLAGADAMPFLHLQLVIIAIVALGAAREGWALTKRLTRS